MGRCGQWAGLVGIHDLGGLLWSGLVSCSSPIALIASSSAAAAAQPPFAHARVLAGPAGTHLALLTWAPPSPCIPAVRKEARAPRWEVARSSVHVSGNHRSRRPVAATVVLGGSAWIQTN